MLYLQYKDRRISFKGKIFNKDRVFKKDRIFIKDNISYKDRIFYKDKESVGQAVYAVLINLYKYTVR